MSNEKAALQHTFNSTRADAKALYKQWQVTPDDSKLLDAYANAWHAHQYANMMMFLNECEEDNV